MAAEINLLDGSWIVCDSEGFRYLGRIVEEDPNHPDTPKDGTIPLFPIYELRWIEEPSPDGKHVVARMIALPDLLLGIGIPARVHPGNFRRLLKGLVHDADLPVFRELVSQAESYKTAMRATRAGLVKS